MSVLHLLGLRGVLLVALVGIVVALAVRIDVLTAHRDTARAELSSATASLAVARAHASQVDADRRIAIAALEAERARAVSAERQAAALRTQIARDAGTDRDGPTAPVLRDAIRGVQRMSTAMPWDLRAWHFIVVVDGRVLAINEMPTLELCRGLAGELAKTLHATPEIVLTAVKVALICRPSGGERSA